MQRRHVHITLGGLLLAGSALAAAALLGAFASHPQYFKNVFGSKLTPAGQKAYAKLDARNYHAGSVNETPPMNAIAAYTARARNEQLAGTLRPLTLAAQEPITVTQLVTNYSGRNGAKVLILVVHDAEMPSLGALQGLYAIRAWFNNPAAQASSNVATDAAGNTIRMVPDDAKAWTQAFFNPWALSDELLGYASQTVWPEAQLRATARLFAAWSVKYGVPVQHAVVSGCTIIRPGILQHSDLGACGGGHHDAGPHFPITRFIELVKEYRAGGYHPKPVPKPRPVPRPKLKPCTTTNVQLALNRRGAHLLVDGAAGPRTRAAVASFQRAHRIQATGRVGKPTCKALSLAA
jgi:hypothetical protein